MQTQYGLHTDTHAHTQIRTSTGMYMHKHGLVYMHIHTCTHSMKGLPLQCCLGSCSHQPSLTPLLAVAITAVSLWVNMDGAAPSTTHTGPNNKTSKSSLLPARLPHAREGLPRSDHILLGSLLDLHLSFGYTLQAFCAPNISTVFRCFFKKQNNTLFYFTSESICKTVVHGEDSAALFSKNYI